MLGTADAGCCTDLIFEMVSFAICLIIKAIYLQVDLGHFVISTWNSWGIEMTVENLSCANTNMKSKEVTLWEAINYVAIRTLAAELMPLYLARRVLLRNWQQGNGSIATILQDRECRRNDNLQYKSLSCSNGQMKKQMWWNSACESQWTLKLCGKSIEYRFVLSNSIPTR